MIFDPEFTDKLSGSESRRRQGHTAILSGCGLAVVSLLSADAAVGLMGATVSALLILSGLTRIFYPDSFSEGETIRIESYLYLFSGAVFGHIALFFGESMEVRR